MNEMPVTPEPDYNSPLEQIQSYLLTEADRAYQAHTFAARSMRMVHTVSLESSLLTTRAIGGDEEQAKALRNVFFEACLHAGAEFSGAFDRFGRPIKDASNEAIYKQAYTSAGEVAVSFLPDALRAAGITQSNEHVLGLLRTVDFMQIVKITEKYVEHNSVPLDAAAIRLKLHDVATEEWRKSKIDTVQITPDIMELSEEDQKIIEIAVRLANATWKVGQVHRAVWEGSKNRISGTDSNFQAYDSMLGGLQKSKGELRAAWEMMKDIFEMQDAMEKVT